MNDDPIAALERELVEAARRRTGGARVGRGRGQLGPNLLTAAILVVTLVIAAGALVFLGGHKRAANPAANGAQRQQLIELLGVLRRPQQPADLRSPAIAALLGRVHPARAPWDRFGTPDLPLVRRATITPWGTSVYLVPVRSAADRPEEGLLVLGGRSFMNCCATVSDLRTSGDLENAGSFARRDRGTTRFVAIVPDGVAKVELMVPSVPPRAGGSGTARQTQVVARVNSNVAALEAGPPCCGITPVLFWFGPGGTVIRRIGDVAGSYRSLALSPPGPQTALSRAAQRDPSTPNRAWITPSTGGPHAVFTIHFRVLIEAADYAYRLSGPCQTPIGTIGHPDGSRGAIWSDQIKPVVGRSWCRGTYRVSVAATDRGPIGPLEHPARPFGAATFTVR